jgi:hypothetical protein
LESVGTETAEAKTARYSTVIENDDEAAAGAATLLNGVFDFTRLDGTMQYNQGGDFSDWTVKAGVAYTSMPSDTTIDPSDPCYGKQWAMWDFPKYAREDKDIDADHTAPVPFDPAAVVGALRQSEATLTEVGSASVRGENTTHYRVQVDGARLDRTFVSDGFDDRELIDMDVWVDGDDRLRRTRWVLEITWGGVPDIGGTYRETTTVEVWDYGVPVEVAAPPASDSCDFPAFFGRSMQDF